MPLRVAGIGELLWDLLRAGRQLGGAPANFTYHAHTLGADAHVVSRVGDDDLGREALERLRRLGLATAAIATDPGCPDRHGLGRTRPDGQPRLTIHRARGLGPPESRPQKRWNSWAPWMGSLRRPGPTDSPRRRRRRPSSRASPNRALRVFDLNLQASTPTRPGDPGRRWNSPRFSSSTTRNCRSSAAN